MILSLEIVEAAGIMTPTFSAAVSLGTAVWGKVSSAKSEKEIKAVVKRSEEKILSTIRAHEKYREQRARFISCFLFDLSAGCSEVEFKTLSSIAKKSFFRISVHDVLSKIVQSKKDVVDYTVFANYLEGEHDQRFRQLFQKQEYQPLFRSLWHAIECLQDNAGSAQPMPAEIQARWLKRIEEQQKNDINVIKSKLDDICDKLPNGEEVTETMKLEEEKHILDEYLESVVAGTDRIDIRGIYSRTGASRDAMHFPIEKNYTPLKIAGTEFRQEAAESSTELIGIGGERAPLTSLLSKYRRLLLIGQPGGGKTTFLKFISCVLAKDNLGKGEPLREEHLGLSVDNPPPIPIFIRLTALDNLLSDKVDVKSTVGNSKSLIVDYIKEDCSEEISKVLEQHLNENRCALLLDGLDEVADEKKRRQILDCVNSVLHYWGENLVVITSRPFGFQDVADFNKTQSVFIDDFDKKEINEFLWRWVNSLYPEQGQGDIRNKYLKEISEEVLTVANIRRLAKNPVMLTCLCVVHWNEAKLPHGKADLMAAVLRWLIKAREDVRGKAGFHNTFAEEAFKALAIQMTAAEAAKKTVADLEWASTLLAPLFLDEYDLIGPKQVKVGMVFLENETLWSGILEKAGVGQVRFWHLTMQEHFAARALVEKSEEERWKIIEPRLWDRQWNEVIDHLAGCLALRGRTSINGLVKNILGTADKFDLTSVARVVGVLGRLLKLLDAYDHYQPPSRLNWEKYRESVMEIFTLEGAAKVPVEERIAAADALGQAGDPRFKDFDPEMLPIPGMDKVLLGKYPVTVEEYRHFVEDGGYEKEEYWADGWDVKKREGWKEPGEWDSQLMHPNSPVTIVSRFEVTAYCFWLGKLTGRAYRLPFDFEWDQMEKAQNKWKNDFFGGKLTKEMANFSNNVGDLTPVGVYPSGIGPGGHLDLIGNVWEWCWDHWQDNDESNIVRGGSWATGIGKIDGFARAYSDSDARYADIGFRICRDCEE